MNRSTRSTNPPITSTAAGRICFAVIDDQCGFYRTFLPASELTARGFTVSVIKNPNIKDLKAFDTVIFEAPFSKSHQELIHGLKGEVRLVLDLDDNYHQILPTNPRYAPLTSVQDIITDIIRTVDELIVATEPLRDFYSRHNKNIRVLPNMMPTELFVDQRNKVPHSAPLRIGWHGGLSHNDDLKILEDVLPSIHREFPDVRFVFFGNAPPLKIPNAEYVEAVPFAAFPATLARLRLDIGLAPLIDVPFNRHKTNLKWMEYAALGIPVVASNVFPYSESIEAGVDGFLASTSDEWRDALRRLILDPALRQSIGRCAHNSVSERYNCKTIGDRYAEAASHWPVRHSKDADRIQPWGLDIFLAAVLCMAGAMVPWLMILPAIGPRDAPIMPLLSAVVLSQALSIATILTAIRKRLALQLADDVARARPPEPDPEQSLADFFVYNRAAANSNRFGREFMMPAFILTILGLVPLALVHREDHPRILPALFCASLPEAAILTFAFTWTYHLISRRIARPVVLPLETFFRRGDAAEEFRSKLPIPAPVGSAKRVLNVGACSKSIPLPSHYNGWHKIYLDVVPNSDVDIVADARNMPSVESAHYDAVYFSHCLEHFDSWEADLVLREIARVLKSDGLLEVRVPNILEVCRRIAAGQAIDAVLYESATGPVAALDMIYGYGQFVKRGSDSMRHKSAFTPAFLKSTLERNGFCVDSICGAGDLELAAIAKKSSKTILVAPN